MAPRAKSSGPKAKAAAPNAKVVAKTAAPAAKMQVKAAAPSAKACQSMSQSSEEKQLEEERKKAEEEAALKAKEEQDERERAAREEAEAEAKRLAALADGDVTIKYNMYAEKFPVKQHTLQAQTIDELYCLSDVMPGCFVHLAEREFAHDEEHTYVREDPPGTFIGLMAGETYWCYVQQDAEQEKRDLERMRKVWEGGVASGIGDRDTGKLKCTCCEGTPCYGAQQSVCLDWANRFTIAEKARRPLDAGFAT
eukprot:gnl/MRDRNA2_/MRDRNA2_34517_c0_seq1.p1 gnl/MRDRNA2_/MRDRNA2_34517_c0~~gnl/MRDRNA2_/MRDRNA2_34517_c0_seq1.p1  ORF type:complete len:283 (-),score=93.12 gnl/MRDRNA2_/MRDRNA2_34517_c0_seq1:29-784(-)